MPSCTGCNATYQVGALFCQKCGARTEAPKPISYRSSVILGIVLFLLILFWQIAYVPTPVSTAESVSKPAPDEAAMLISKCGEPDLDHSAEKDKPTPNPNRRWLIYRKARVKAVFIRPSATEPWKSEALLDTKTQKPLAPEFLARRLPCANSGTR